MLTTAAGTARPAKVLILGTGVAGLQAIGTARRLGAVVSAYDVRPQTKTEVQSLGGTFIELDSVADAAGRGGYARALTDEERQAQQAELAGHIARHDVIITTAQVPGRKPPLLVTEDALKEMTAGAVIVDMGRARSAATWPARCPAQTVVTGNGVTIIGAGNLAATVPGASSRVPGPQHQRAAAAPGQGRRTGHRPQDEIQAGVVITHDGAVVQPATAALLADAVLAGTSPEVLPRDPGTAHRHHHLRARHPGGLRGDQQGARHPAHPLMSAANSIHGIVLAGALLIAVTAHDALGYILAFIACAFAAANVVGGYVVTGRMLKMFHRTRTPVRAPDDAAAVSGNGQAPASTQPSGRS